MITMVDEIFDRHYQEARGELNEVIARSFGQLGHAVRNAFNVLNRIEYQAPWIARTKRARCN
jgi:hypothetical protein